MPLPVLSRPPPVPGKDYRIRPLKRGDKDALFKLLAADGWVVPAADQETVLSWVVQHPEMESFVAHHAASYGSVFAVLTLSHPPQLRLPGPRDDRHDFFEEHGFSPGGEALYVRRLNPLG